MLSGVAEERKPTGARKQVTPGQRTGKVGMLELERVLTRAGLVIQPVDTQNDIGRDAYVEVIDETDVTGRVVAVQVKSGASYFHKGSWVVPGSPADFTLWRESSLPMFGVVHDPTDDSLRWANLSEAAVAEAGREPFSSGVVDGPYGRRAVEVSDENRLDLSVAAFKMAAEQALRRRSGSPAYHLLSRDNDEVRAALLDSFAVGRNDARPLVLVAALLGRFPREVLPLAVHVLSMATRHPDVFWTKQNWISSAVKTAVAAECHWTTDDVALLLSLVAEDEAGVQRGSFGQSIYHVLELDTSLDKRLQAVLTDVHRDLDARRWAAVILLYRQDDAQEMLAALEHSAPDLWDDAWLIEVREMVEGLGHFSLF